jgi:ATP-binding cassette subfamily B protein
VLDDATSSLDTVTEMLITRAITGGLSGLTRLIVAHRETTAARADLVAWLDGGRIRALAPHGELRAGREYRAIFDASGGTSEGTADCGGEAC